MLITRLCFLESPSESCSTMRCSANGLSGSGACSARADEIVAASNAAITVLPNALTIDRPYLAKYFIPVPPCPGCRQHPLTLRQCHAASAPSRNADVWQTHPTPAFPFAL